MSKKELNTTPGQLLILCSSDPKLKAISSLLKNEDICKSIEDYIIDNGCLTYYCEKNNPLLFDGAYKFISEVNYISERIIIKLLNSKDISWDIYESLFVPKNYTNQILKYLNSSTLMMFLNKNWEHYSKLDNEIIDIILHNISGRKFTDDIITILINLYSNCDKNVPQDTFIASWILGNTNFMRNLSTEQFCLLFSECPLESGSSEKICDEVAIFKKLPDETLRRYKLSSDEDKMLIEEAIASAINYIFLVLYLFKGGLSFKDSIISKYLFTIFLHSMESVINSYSKLDAVDIRKSIIETIVDISINGKLKDEYIESFKDFSFIVWNQLIPAIDSDMIKKLDIENRIKPTKDDSIIIITILKNCMIKGCIKDKKITIKSKIINFLKKVKKAFTKDKVVEELYGEIMECLDYILSIVTDNDAIEAFEKAKENTKDIYNKFVNNAITRTVALKELKPLLKEIKEVRDELEKENTNEIDELYSTLGIDDNDKGDIEKLNKAYKKWVQVHHPDKFQDEAEKKKANEIFIKITELYKNEKANIFKGV